MMVSHLAFDRALSLLLSPCMACFLSCLAQTGHEGGLSARSLIFYVAPYRYPAAGDADIKLFPVHVNRGLKLGIYTTIIS